MCHFYLCRRHFEIQASASCAQCFQVSGVIAYFEIYEGAKVCELIHNHPLIYNDFASHNAPLVFLYRDCGCVGTAPSMQR